MGEAYASSDESLFKNLAALTSNSSALALQLARCIRDLAYGDGSQTDDLVAMVRSDDPEMRRLLEVSLWRLTPEEEARERRAL